jgi:hypothetical protein
MPIEIRKTLTDAGYVAVGLGVLGYQQAQVRRRELQQRLGSTGGCLNARAVDGKSKLDTVAQTVGEKAQSLRGLRDNLETQARSANGWAQELGAQVKERIEPVIGQVVDQVGERVKIRSNPAA